MSSGLNLRLTCIILLMGNMLYRAIRAALLRSDVYRQAAMEPESILKSLGIVIMAGLSFSLGLASILDEGIAVPELSGLSGRLIDIWLVLVTTLLGWILWSAIGFFICKKLFKLESTFHQVLRALGICYGPGFLAIIPVMLVGLSAFIIGALWTLLAAICAIKEIQSTDWFSALLSLLLGWVLCVVRMPYILLSPLSN